MTANDSSSRPAWLAAYAAVAGLAVSSWTFYRYDAPLREHQMLLDSQQATLNAHAHELAKYDKVIKQSDATAATSTNLDAKAYINAHGRSPDRSGIVGYLIGFGYSFVQQSSNPITVDGVEMILDVTETPLLDLLEKNKDVVLNEPEGKGVVKWRNVHTERRARTAFLERADKDYPNQHLTTLKWDTSSPGWEETLGWFPKGTGNTHTWNAVVKCGKLGYARMRVKLYYSTKDSEGATVGRYCSFEGMQVLTNLPPMDAK